MLKLLALLTGIFLLTGCSTKEKKPTVAVKQQKVTNDTDAVLIAAEQKLLKLSVINDSTAEYIRLNSNFYDSAIKWKRDKASDKFLENIMSRNDQIKGDTLLIPFLAKAYGRWGINHHTPSYNDTVVTRLEKFLLLTKGQYSTHVLTPYAYQYLGIQYNVLGDLKKSIAYHSLFNAFAKESKDYDKYASNIVNTAIALNELYLFDSSIQLIKTIIDNKEIKEKRIASLYVTLAISQSGKKQFTESIVSANKSLQILNNILPNEIDSSTLFEKKYLSWWTLGDIQLIAGNLQESKMNLDSAYKFLSLLKNGDLKNREFGKLFLSRGRLSETMGNLPNALSWYHKALYCVTNIDSTTTSQLPAKKDLYAENTIMDALDAKAGVLQRIYATNKKPDLLIQAVSCYELAFETERKLTLNFSYDESLARQTRESKKRSEKAIAICHNLFKLTGSSAWADKAFLFAESSKGIVLQESTKRNLAKNSTLQNDTNWTNVQRYQQEVNFYEKKLANVSTNDTGALNLLTHKLSAAENNLLMANTALLHSNSAYREALLKTDSLSATILKDDLLDTHTTLLEFFTGDSSTYIFLITKNAPPQFIKTDSSLSTSINQLLLFFTDKNKINNEPQAYQAAAYRLYQQTGLSSINKQEIKKLIIIPDGRLNFVPFDALVTDVKTVQNPQLFSYLLHQQQVSYGYSVNTLLKQANYSSTSTGQFICFAPVFANKERGNSPLLHTIEETDAIKKETPAGKFYLKEQATSNQFKNTVAGARIIHVASHASADTSGGLQPMIEFYDSSLSLNEIYTLHINPRLVVLSACETGIGIIDKSEGAMSLARGFYYAGAQNIVTSLWSVDDKSTAGIFSSFYRHTGGNDFSLALHEAKLAYLSTASLSSASPYYWAGFIHIGHQQPPGKNNQGIWIIAVIAAALLSFFMLRKRR